MCSDVPKSNLFYSVTTRALGSANPYCLFNLKLIYNVLVVPMEISIKITELI